jgi:small subunit ribosomal protein S2
MEEYIFGERNNIHIIDLAQTVPLLHQALKAVSDTVAKGGRLLMVGTKRQAQEAVATSATECAQYFVNARWLGGMLTNWKTISNSIRRLNNLEEMMQGGEAMRLTKKERLNLDREREKLERNLGGIKSMGGVPDIVFVIDTNRESIAVQEARRLNIPIVAILDTNSDPEGITHPVPGNDDAARAITLYCELVSRAALDGLLRSQGETGYDVGESAQAPYEPALAEAEEGAEAPAEGGEPQGASVEDLMQPAPGDVEGQPAEEKQNA